MAMSVALAFEMRHCIDPSSVVVLIRVYCSQLSVVIHKQRPLKVASVPGAVKNSQTVASASLVKNSVGGDI
jgi:hypothetical protein